MAEFAISCISLHSRLQSGALQTGEALAIAAETGRLLARAHAAGKVHGNLTDAGILLQGSAVSLEGFDGNTPTLENADHLAPERQAGGPPSIAADIYSFGQILEQLRQAGHLDLAVDQKWERAALRCMDPDPEQRFPSMQSVLQAMGADSAQKGEIGLEPTVTISSSKSVTEAPKRWGNFQLLQRLGAGGFGEVYRAWDLTLEREVALKLLLPRGRKPEEELAAMVAEGRAMARVRHPNTVQVYGVDRHEGRVGLWSDLIHGQTLARWVAREGSLPGQQTAEIGIALCDALTAVHDAGLLHCDIKPGNVMRADDGRILLMDFGLSHELHEKGVSGGTLEYMAPELLQGAAPSVESDIYAMGMLLRFVCAGKQLGKSEMVTKKLPPGVAPGLRYIIERATHQDPEKRYSSAPELRNALASVAGTSIPVLPARGSSLRTRIAWIAAIVIVLCALAALIPATRKDARAWFAGTNRAAYQDYLAAEDALLRYDKPGNTQKAVSLYQETLQRSPNFTLADAGLARAEWRMYLDTGDKNWSEAASQAAAQAAARNPNLAPVQMTLGMIHVEQGKFSLGMQELEQARQLDPRSADVHAATGEAYRMQGRLADAKSELQTAIDLAPEDWRWPYLLGALQLDAGDFQAAESNLKLALEKTPDNPRVLYNLGLVYRKQDRLPEAEKVLQHALHLDERSSTIMALGLVLVLEGRYDDAVEKYKRAAEMNPGSWRVWGNLAFASQWTGRNPEEASGSFAKAIELAGQQIKITPDNPALNHALGSFHASLHDRARALPYLRKALLLAPNDPDNLENVAESYEALGDREEALRLIAKALALGFSPVYARKTPALRTLRPDSRAPEQIRETTNSQITKSKG